MDSPEQFFPEFHLTLKMLIYLVGLLFWAPWLRLVRKCSNSNLNTHFHSTVNSTVSAFQLVAIPSYHYLWLHIFQSYIHTPRIYIHIYFQLIQTYIHIYLPPNINTYVYMHTHIFQINPNIHTHISPQIYIKIYLKLMLTKTHAHKQSFRRHPTI